MTGGLGFIGSNFIRFLLEKHSDLSVINLDKVTYCGNPENLRDVERNPRYEFIRGDICDRQMVEKVMEGCETVFHFAAQSHVDRSILDAAAFVETNIVGTHILLEAAKKKGLKKVIQISTDEVYGSIEEGSFSEESPLSPSSPYSASKASADLLCLAYFRTYGLPVIITRCTNNFGPYQYPEKLVSLFVTNAIENRKLPLYGRGLNVREWVYVLDHCEALDRVWQKGKEGEVYNIGSGERISNKEMSETILKLLGKPSALIETVKDRPGHDLRYAVDSQKVRSLGWSPRRTLSEALRETVEWYETHRAWWQGLKLEKKEFQSYYKAQYGRKE